MLNTSIFGQPKLLVLKYQEKCKDNYFMTQKVWMTSYITDLETDQRIWNYYSNFNFYKVKFLQIAVMIN